MKTKNKLYLLATTAATLSLSATTGFGQVFDSVEALNNRAIAASPRAKEAFPWLSRAPSPSADACCDKGEAKSQLTEAKKNRAYAASPRVREIFPELGRTPVSHRELTIVPFVEKNTAVLASPRAREEFPALMRGVSPGWATGGPSKSMESGSVKGGASKLMEPGK